MSSFHLSSGQPQLLESEGGTPELLQKDVPEHSLTREGTFLYCEVVFAIVV